MLSEKKAEYSNIKQPILYDLHDTPTGWCEQIFKTNSNDKDELYMYTWQ